MDARPLDDLVIRFATYQSAVGRAAGTRERYGYTFVLFRRFLEDAEMPPTSRSLTTEAMEGFAIWLRETPVNPQHGNTRRAESTTHAHLRDMRAFTRWLVRTDLLPKDLHFPMPTVPRRLFRVLTDAELERMWNSAYLTGSSPRSIRNRAMVALMLDTGLRREEVARLTLDGVSLAGRMVTVIGKGNKERRVPFSTGVRDYLKEFLAIRGIDHEPLFHLHADGIRTTFRRIQLETGLEKFHPHQLRHQCATMMLRKGTHPEMLSMMLGHEDYNTTRRYLTTRDEDLQEAHEGASPFETFMEDRQVPEPIQRRRRYSSKGVA